MRSTAVFSVDLKLLEENIQRAQVLAEKKKLLFMIKANGYGHGAKALYQFCAARALIENFGVATLGEAIELRTAFPKLRSNIYVFSDLEFQDPDSRNMYEDLSLIPVLSNISALRIFFQNSQSKKRPFALMVDVGMKRLGLESDYIEEVSNLISSSGCPKIFHLMAHFSSAGLSAQNPVTLEQEKRFQDIKEQFEKNGIEIQHCSLANSAGIQQSLGKFCDFVRPGLMLYGPSGVSFPTPWNTNVISSLQVQILKKRQMLKGEALGYGQSILEDSGAVYIVAMGYADGMLLHFQGLEFSCSSGQFKIVGRPNMDLLFIQAMNSEAETLREGDWINLWDFKRGGELLFAKVHSPYQLFCSIGSRIPRNYLLK